MAEILLCVNIDHIATIRQARGGFEPDPVRGAMISEQSGADGITVHLREDRRHIQDSDVVALRDVVRGKFNLEMALSEDVVDVAKRVVPDQITLVPEKRQELTTEGGLDVRANMERIRGIVEVFHGLGVLVSLFIEPDREVVDLSKRAGADFVEIHTGSYCNARGVEAVDREIGKILDAASHAVDTGLRVNAGHGLNYDNVAAILGMKGLEELNIGHSIIANSVFTGLSEAVRAMKSVITGHGPSGTK